MATFSLSNKEKRKHVLCILKTILHFYVSVPRQNVSYVCVWFCRPVSYNQLLLVEGKLACYWKLGSMFMVVGSCYIFKDNLEFILFELHTASHAMQLWLERLRISPLCAHVSIVLVLSHSLPWAPREILPSDTSNNRPMLKSNELYWLKLATGGYRHLLNGFI
jgi:hypothetical protein